MKIILTAGVHTNLMSNLVDDIPVPEEELSPQKPGRGRPRKLWHWAFYHQPLNEFVIILAPSIEAARPRALARLEDMRVGKHPLLKNVTPDHLVLVKTNSPDWVHEFNGLLYSAQGSLTYATTRRTIELIFGHRSDYRSESMQAAISAYRDHIAATVLGPLTIHNVEEE